ncbi:MAG: MiaB/RimO family radical SAM methylthiotransferase [Anaerolineae bacterium]|nr:MiaB/RimO family radical SAM methylthiotransferase [Anaerolineae bacterium]
MKKYHIWTIGCQMNEADSGRVAAELDALGYAPTSEVSEADVIVLNTCVVRQSAEERAVGRLWSVRPLKQENPERVVALMGCMVGIKPNGALKQRFPFVDVFMPPSDPAPLVGFLKSDEIEAEAQELDAELTSARHLLQELNADDADDVDSQDYLSHLENPPDLRHLRPIPAHPMQSVRHLSLHGRAPVVAHVPIVYGCSHACTFCIIPFRRGVERSRPLDEVVAEVRGLVAQGVREVTLLGQIVDRYGKDFPGGRPDLADLLEAVNDIDGLYRIRFLTSHPNYMTDRILEAVARLPKVCEQIEVPVQAGDDEVLAEMKRGYTVDQYRALVGHIREVIPNTAIHTDIIVGFPGESAEQFERTRELLMELKIDKAHLAMYSPRPGTVSERRMTDDVPAAEKKRRWDALDAVQREVVGEINRRNLGEVVEVLVEEKHKGRWRGRTRHNKLVYFDDAGDWLGQLAPVRITWAGPWSMIGEIAG